jgi:hypothetical protein
MKLRLVITTDGRPDVLDRALESYDQHVRPRPDEYVVVDDSGDPGYRDYLTDLLLARKQTYGGQIKLASHGHRLGFCETVAHAWRLAGEPGGVCPHCDEASANDWSSGAAGATSARTARRSRSRIAVPDWVFWLEDDFVFTRTIPLVDLAFVLERQMRARPDEPPAAAGLRRGGRRRRPAQDRPGALRASRLGHLDVDRAIARTGRRTRALFRREFAASFPAWPVVDHCEGMFTHRPARRAGGDAVRNMGRRLFLGAPRRRARRRRVLAR